MAGMARYSDEIKDAARALYLKGFTPQDIAREIAIPVRTVYHWSEKGNWPAQMPVVTVEESLARRINQLGGRENKTALEIDEYQMLVTQHVKLMAQRNKHAEQMASLHARATPSGSGDTASSAAPGEKNRKNKKNDVSGMTAEKLDQVAREHLFDYQLHCRAHSDEDFRFILKARQIGMTYYFAWEALEKAITTGTHQVFFSASKAQAEIFRLYIVDIAQRQLGITLTGNPIRLSNGAILRFLSTNANTSQGYNGDLYGDEVFWIPKFARLHDVASAMATHSKFRTTYFSTPSAKTHQAYGLWTGDEWRGDDPKRKHVAFPKDNELRDGGRRGPDGIWRYLITMEDAVTGGLDALVNIERLRKRYSATTYAMLYMCQFVDSKDAVFRFADLSRCEVDAGIWQDHDPSAARPFGNREVWAGFDPSRSGDNSTFVIVAPPMFDGERFRVLAVYHWQGLNFTWQAEQIKQLMRRYNMTYIGIDVTGIGRGVHDLVTKFAPREATPILYGVESKSRLVLKMIDTVERGRIEWSKDAQDEVSKERADIIPSFMAIRRTTTASGNAMTFVAERSETTGHADVFFAIAHAVINEPLDYEYDRPSTWTFGKAA